MDVFYQCIIIYCLQRGPKVRITAFSVYFAITFFGLINQNCCGVLNLIYFTTRGGWQKPDKHYVTKSHKIIVDSPFRYSGSLVGRNWSSYWKLFGITLHNMQSTPVNLAPLPSDTNCQGTKFLNCNVLCFVSIIEQPDYPTMSAKF